MSLLSKSKKHNLLRPVCNSNGQGLIEYLIIVALMGVATIAIMRVMQETVSKQFASVTNALQGEATHATHVSTDSFTKKKDMKSFFNGAGGGGKNGNDDSASND